MNYGSDSKWGDIKRPTYYTKGVECIDVMMQQFGANSVLQFCILNAFKYMFRCKQKHDDPIDDLKKAQWYINKAIETYEKEIHKTNNKNA